MASPSAREAMARKLFDNLQSDLKSLSAEAKKKHPPVKEASEACMLKLRMISTKSTDLLADLLSSSSELIQPFIMGCDTKIPKMVHISLTSMQRMIQHQAISATTADNIIKSLWNLMNSGVEELKLLQTAILMITTNSLVQHESLARALVLGFRLYFTKDSTTINTAGATVRQLVNAVYDRVVTEDSIQSQMPLEPFSTEKLKAPSKTPPASLQPCAQDGFLLFQDLCQLVNADNPVWLTGITEMTRTFGLELLESVMSNYPQIFIQHEEFGFLLKERVCPLVIKLFSPSLKFRQAHPSGHSPIPSEKPYFPIVMRLLRIVQTLIRNFYSLLSTECEIFLSLLVKFMDIEKPMWQRCIALEVVHKICNEPTLIRSFVETYDMKEHSAKIFYDIVSAIGSFIQTLFMPTALHSQTSRDNNRTPDTQGAPPSLVAGMPVGGGVTPQPAFVYKNLWIPLIMNVPQTPVRSLLIEMVDKLDPPAIPDGYALTLGFACLLDIGSSVERNILPSTAGSGAPVESEKKVFQALVNSSWGGLLASLSLLLEASTDEQATEAILKADQSYVNLAGILDMKTTRDAFVTALCKASLPPHYQILVLNQPAPNPALAAKRGHVRVSSLDFKVNNQQQQQQPHPQYQQQHQYQHEEVYDKSQVVAVGTPLPTLNMPPNVTQSQVMLTAKNISCMRAILSLAHCHGGVLANSWNMVLTTLQHLVWILGLKAASGGQLKTEKSASDNAGAVITTAIMADLPVLSDMLSRLFESSQYLDDVALHHLIDALCKLSTESLEIAYSNREPSLFAVAKILETGLVNLNRVEVMWKPLTAHLLEVCHHTHASMRCCGAEAITSLVSAALLHQYDPPLYENKRLQAMLLAPLRELSVISQTDVRQRQLECALLILQNGGETLGPGWPTILQVIGDGANTQGEVIIRTAFQSMQLVVTDFLPLISPPCLSLCVEMAAKFGLQHSELNISLTAIGLLWNISDYFYQQRAKISSDIVKDADPSLTSSDQLWMCLYSKFGELCVDSRPAVRKSAGQTLFSTIAAHGDLLQNLTWKSLLWKVLFPLLDNVKNNLEVAPSERAETEANILIHHSRDTAKKQWCETQVLIMAGVSRVFSIKKANLEELDDFSRAWAFLLQYLERASMGVSAEVSLAALKSFQELVSDQPTIDGQPAVPAPPTQNTIVRGDHGDHQASSQAIWKTAWKVWLNIGNKRTTPPPADQTTVDVPSQAFLCELIKIFPKIFSHVQDYFVADMFNDFSKVLSQSLAVPIAGDTSPFLVPTNYESTMTPVQETVIQAYKCLCQSVSHINSSEKLYPMLIQHLIRCSELATKPPTFGSIPVKPPNSVKGMATGYIASEMTEFSEKCMSMATDVYCGVANLDSVINDETFKHIIKSLNVPLGAKYSCISSSTWKLAVSCLLQCMKSALPIARTKGKQHSKELWPMLSKVLGDFLFPKTTAHADQPLSEFKEDEHLDCQIVDMIRTEILPHSAELPQDFITSLVQLLNKGSIHSQTNSATVTGKVRHMFTQKCFETLLQFSFVNGEGDNSSVSGASSNKSPPVSQMAVRTLLSRCSTIINKYNSDVELKRNVPPPRSQVNEVVSSIQTAATLINSLKEMPPKTVDEDIWREIIGLYPSLVNCVHSKSEPVLAELQKVLLAYSDLLSNPRQLSALHNGS